MTTPVYELKAESGHYDLSGHSVRMINGLGLQSDGPFFEYVLTFLCACAGLTPVYDSVGYPRFMAGTLGAFPRANGNAVHMDLDEAVGMARRGTLVQERAEQRLCCMLANSAFESVAEVDRDRLKGEPLFEFFRHVRNAASHANEWHFIGKEPVRRAEWNGIVLDSSMNGATLIYGTLDPADLLYLLRDVEALLK